MMAINARFGALLVLAEAERSAGARRCVLCRCDCGTEIVVRLDNLRSGATRSCGCLRQKIVAERSTTHGMSQRVEYRAWEHIIKRCTNRNADNYKYYGGRGIKVHPAWRRDFATFFAAVGSRPSSNHSIDRIDNSQGYVPGNVRWATRKEQARNTRRNRLIAWQGKTQPLVVWAEELGVPKSRLESRLGRGWSVEKAFTK
jgi:hypothetical protein